MLRFCIVWGKDYEAQNRIFRALRISQEFREGCDRFKFHARLHSYRRKNGSVLETRVVGSGSVMSNSPEDKERITRILMTGMSDEQLRLIGQIAVIWNNNKFLFERLIWRAAKWEAEAGVLVTADLSSVSRETFAKNIIQKQVTDEEWKEYTLATVALFVEARITRNNLIHSLPKFRPTFDPESLLSSVGHKRSAKGGSGTIKTTEYDRSATALNEFVTILMHLGLALQTAEIRLRDFVSPPDDDMPVTLIDKATIRMLIDQLRSARRSEGKA